MNYKRLLGTVGIGLVLAAGFTLAQPQKVQIAQTEDAPGAIPMDPGDASAVSLPRDNKMKSRIEAAQDYIKSKDWAEATNVLQKLVEIKEDVFAELPRKAPDGKDAIAIVSVRTEANRLIASLPPKGLEFYKLTFNPPAAGLLREAKASGDPNLLAQIVRQYLHTDAGGEAASLLGTYHLDRGNFMAASLCFERLLEREGADKLSPRALFKAAFAFYQAGDAARGQRIWQMLTAKGLKEMNLGGATMPLEDLRTLAMKINRAHEAGVFDWLLFGGNQRRNAEAPGGTAFMEPRWKSPTLRTDETRSWLRMAENYLVQQRAQAMIPAFFPLAVTINRNDQKVPLLVYRSYWGVHAVQLKTGKLEWEARSEWSIDTVSREPRKSSVFNTWLGQYVQNNLRPAILFENSSLGSLASDGKFVFAVEDLAVPPPPNMNAYGTRPNTSSYGVASKDVLDAILHSKLHAYDLVTGKLKWEAGGRGEKGDLMDTFFLGPPLPVSGKLHVLTEKQQELRLATLDPATGKLLAMQTLVTTRDKLEQDIGRRTQAAHLAYGEGILVCPTNSGALLGVDLLTGSLVWAYMYRDKGDGTEATWDPNKNGGQMRAIRRIDGRYSNPNLNNQWKVTAPVIHEGRVIFTAPDARAIHCVNLRDGMKIWTQTRQEDDLFFAGVHCNKALVVGRKMCRAIDLTNGQTSWTLETGVPSGMGVAFDNIYYLPLKEASGTKEPEICAIDLSRGQILAHTRSRKKEVPGNLLFFEGEVLSQSTTDLAAFPQLAVKLGQIDQLIQANPRDPVGLTERGELRLDKGDLRGAITDLKDALGQNPPPAVVEKARQKLYEAFTDYFQRDFTLAEPFLKEYEELCKVEIRADAQEKDKLEMEAEGKRRRANFLCLIAKGREKQGRLVEAFEKYQEFAAVAPGDELISVIDEPSVRAAGEVWSQGRIAAMVANATAENKKPLEDRIRLQWEELEKKGAPLAELKKFVATCGSLFAIGQEARMRLAEKLLDDGDANAMLMAEQHVQTVIGETPALAARGYEILARLYTRKGLLDDAAWCYRKLGSDYPDAIVRDGRKGSDFFNDLAADKRFLPYLSLNSPQLPPNKIRVTEERGNFHQQTQTYRFEPPIGDLPYFQRHRMALRFDYHALRLTDSITGDEVWSKNLTRTLFQNLVYGNGQSHLVRFPLQSQGHLVILPLGHLVFALDPVGKRVLWEKNLYSPIGTLPGQAGAGSPPGYNQLNVDPDGTMRVLYPDGWGQRIGLSNPLSSGILALQTRDGLVAIDPVSGKVLWTRSDINSRAILFAEGKHLFVVEMSPENNPTSTRALRAYDGVSVRVPDFTQVFAKRLRNLGGTLLMSDNEANGTVTMRLYDVLQGKDTWKESFPAGTIVLKTEEEPQLTGVVEPDGKVRVWRLPEGKLVLNTRVETRHLIKGSTIHLLADAKHYYLGINAPVNANIMPWGGIQSNLMPGNGMRALPLNGELYAFDRETGKMRWHNPLVNQMIVLDSYKELPLLLFTARYHKMMANGPVRNVIQVVAAKSIDKRTGKLLYDNENIPNGIQFHALNYDPRGGRIDFVNYQLKIIHHLENDSGKSATGGE